MNCFFGLANLGKLPVNFSAKFDGKFFPGSFRPRFSRASAPPPQKFTPEIVGFLLQFHVLEPKWFSRRFSACGQEQHVSHRDSHVSSPEHRVSGV